MILGIDIGVQGAVAVLDQAGALVEVHDMPTLQDGPKGGRAVNAPLLASIIFKSHATAAFVECLTLKSKDAARSEAIRRWPDHAALFARVKDDGRAESALIGVAGQTARRPWPSRVHLYAIGSAQGARAGLMNGADRKAVKSELRGHANG
jgi:hypothetical protein